MQSNTVPWSCDGESIYTTKCWNSDTKCN